MRSFRVFGASRTSDLVLGGAGNRPEMLRRKTVLNNAHILLAAAALCMTPAIYALVTGAPLPCLLSAIVLAGGLASLTLQRRGQVDLAVAGQVATLMATGLVLTLADPQLGDAGLAVAVMGPVLAALVARTALRRLSWLIAVLVAMR